MIRHSVAVDDNTADGPSQQYIINLFKNNIYIYISGEFDVINLLKNSHFCKKLVPR
jgi:hypothetical protein